MTPSEQCKAAGLTSLAELSRITSASVGTLANWSKHKPVLFEVVLFGAAEGKIRSTPTNLKSKENQK